MAFNSANLSKWSNYNVPGPQLFGYKTTTDNVATVSTSTYFTPFADSLLQTLLPFPLNVGDTIQANCTDGTVDLVVTSIDPIATAVETVDVIVGPNSVNTAAIQNLAVTAAKIANATITNTQISNTAGITGTQLANGTITTTQISGTAGITGAQLAATTVAASNIVSGTITHTQISNTANIVGTQLANNTIAAAQLAANTVASGQLDLTTIQYVKIPMTAAQWNGMYAAPFQLIAAPGAGLAIVVKNAVAVMTYVSTQYAGGGAIALQYSNTVDGAGTLASGAIAAATVNGFTVNSSVSATGLVAAAANSTIANEGIFLSNLSGSFTTGNGTWNIHIWYSVVTL